MKNGNYKKKLKIIFYQFINHNKNKWSKKALLQAEVALEILLKWAAYSKQNLNDLSSNWIDVLEEDILERKLNNQFIYENKLIYSQLKFWLDKKNNDKIINCSNLNSRPKLPKVALDFLSFISVRSKKNTIKAYKNSIYRLYFFLNEKKIIIKKLNRAHAEQLLLYLTANELKASTRRQYMIHIRVYLLWLYEKGCITNDPNSLIRKSDFPKLPKYLPRSFSSEIDQEIQKRLTFFDGTYHRALLLLRYTGMRAGEVCNLSYHCLVNHGKGYCLKVPLGKLDKERLVPIDLNTFQLIEQIRKQCNQYSSKQRNYLLCNRAGKKITYFFLHNTFRSITYDLKTDQAFVIHQLRHTYATQLSNAGMNVISLQKILGHNDIAMTLHYIHTNSEKIQAEYLMAIKKISNQYKNGIPEAKRINPSFTPNDHFLALKKMLTDQRTTPSKQLIRFYNRFERIKTDFFSLLNRNDQPS